MDIILRRVRGSCTYNGGVLTIASLNTKQIMPIKGIPAILSPHILTCYVIKLLKHSVRCALDAALQRLQDITRYSHKYLEENPHVVDEFVDLASSIFTFVETWDDPAITSRTVQVFSRAKPVQEARKQFVDRIKQITPAADLRIKIAEDLMLPMESHRDWQPASQRVSTFLDSKVKEPSQLVLYKHGLYQFTFNDKDNKFSQSRFAYLLDLPSQANVDEFKPITVWAAPAGCKRPADAIMTEQQLQDARWTKVQVGCAPMYEQSFSAAGLRSARKQYGLQHYVSATIHLIQGATLLSLATQISWFIEEHRLWEKGQLVVITSRTALAKDTIFVGNKEQTLDMLKRALLMRSQYGEYMEHVIKTLVGEESEPPIVQAYINPYRPMDIPLPRDLSGFCYLLVSSQDWTTTYIGQTKHLHERLIQHNSGRGAKQTSPYHLRPWVLVAYVCGFDFDRKEHQNFELAWRNAAAARMINENSRSIEAIIQAAADVIRNIRHVSLRVVQHARIENTHGVTTTAE